jgi:hypothetical protein
VSKRKTEKEEREGEGGRVGGEWRETEKEGVRKKRKPGFLPFFTPSKDKQARLKPVILASQEAEIRRIMVRCQTGQIVCETVSRTPFTKKKMG